MDPDRRVILKRGLVAGSIMVSLCSTSKVWARWPAEVFDSSDVNQVLRELADGQAAVESDRILIDVPESVENAAIVPVRVTADLADVESISLLVNSNHSPLAANFRLGAGVRPQISTRLRLEQTGNITALVKSRDGYFVNAGQVLVRDFVCEPRKQKN